MPSDYDVFYQPYNPLNYSLGGSDSMLKRLSLMGLDQMTRSAGLGSATAMLPSGYSNFAQLQSRMASDEMHRNVMAAAASQDRIRVGNVVSGMFDSAAGLGLKGLTPMHQTGFQKFAGAILPMAATLAQGGDDSRRLLDIATAGHSVANLSSPLQQLRKRFRDPITGQVGLSEVSIANMATSADHYLFGGDRLTNRGRNAGFMSGDMAPVMDFLSRSGQMRSATGLQQAMGNPYMVSAIRSGAMSGDVLKRVGLEGITDIVQHGAASIEGQTALQNYGGQAIGESMRGPLKAMRAVKEIFEAQGLGDLVKNAGQLVEKLDQFNQMYSGQVSYERMGGTIRSTSVALRDFNVGWAEIAQRASVATKLAIDAGLDPGAADPAVRAGALFERSSKLGGTIVQGYGSSTPEQAAMMRQKMIFDYAKSPQGNISLALSRLADTYGKPKDPELAAIVAEMHDNVPVSNQKWLAMNTGDRAQFIAERSGWDPGVIAEFFGQDNANQEQGFGNRPDMMEALFQAEARKETEKNMIAAASGSAVFGGRLQGKTGEDLVKLMATATVKSTLSLSPEVLQDTRGAADRGGKYVVGGQAILDALNVAANDTNNPALAAAAKAELAGMGTSLEARQQTARTRASVLLAAGLQGQDLLAVTGQFGDPATKELDKARQEVKITTMFENLLHGSSAAESATAFANFSGTMEGMGLKVGSEGIKEMGAMASEILAKEGGAQKEDYDKISVHMKRVQAGLQEKIDSGKDTPAQNRANQLQVESLGVKLKEFAEYRGLESLEDKGKMAAGMQQDADGKWVKVGVPADVASALTFEIGAITMQFGEDVLVEAGKMKISAQAKRGSSQTAGAGTD